MPDIPKRLYGPAPVYLASGKTMYTVPPETTTFIRDITFTNADTTNREIRVSIGDLSDVEKRVFDYTVTAGTTYSFRGLWVMNENEYIQGQQITAIAPVAASAATGTGGAASSISTGAWTPSADTLYLLGVAWVKTDAPDAISSITGNGTWTVVPNADGVTSGSVAATNDIRLSVYYWYSSAAGGSATTTVNFGGVNQAASVLSIGSVSAVSRTGTSGAYASVPIIQSANNVDLAAPGSTNSGLAVTLADALTGGVTIMFQARATSSTSTAPTGYTSAANNTVAAVTLNYYYVTTPPASSATVPANTWSASNTTLRAAAAVELAPAPSSTVNLMINGVEVT
jgi:hypothetical protein